MTATEARANVDAMKRETPRSPQRALLKLALRPGSKLSDAAREIYAARLSEID